MYLHEPYAEKKTRMALACDHTMHYSVCMHTAVTYRILRNDGARVGTSRTRAAADKRVSGYNNGRALQPMRGPRRVYRVVVALRVLGAA